MEVKFIALAEGSSEEKKVESKMISAVFYLSNWTGYEIGETPGEVKGISRSTLALLSLSYYSSIWRCHIDSGNMNLGR